MRTLIIYTDGSARPNPGYGGWGLHGYLIDDEEKVKPVASPAKYVITDAGYMTKEIAKFNDKEKTSPVAFWDACGGEKADVSNNEMELEALFQAYELASEVVVDKLLVLSDSTYTINGSKKSLEAVESSPDISNKERWVKTLKAKKKLKDSGVTLSIDKVVAHADNLGNNTADRHAVTGTGKSHIHDFEPVIVKSDVKGYWRKPVIKDPLLLYRTLFFTTGNTSPVNTYMTYHTDSDLPEGKSSAGAKYSILKLDEPIEYIDRLINKQRELSAGYEENSLLSLDKAYSLNVLKDSAVFGEAAFRPPLRTHKSGVYHNSTTPITTAIKPPGLSYRIITRFTRLQELMDRASGKIPPDGQHKTFEIKDMVLEFIEMKSKDAAIKKREDGKTMKIITGVDMPPLSTFKKILKTLEAVTVIYWNEGALRRHAVYVKTANSESIWSNFHAALTI